MVKWYIDITEKPTYQKGDRRTKEGFLLFPKTSMTTGETRWMVKAKWTEEAYEFKDTVNMCVRLKWKVIKWL